MSINCIISNSNFQYIQIHFNKFRKTHVNCIKHMMKTRQTHNRFEKLKQSVIQSANQLTVIFSQ